MVVVRLVLFSSSAVRFQTSLFEIWVCFSIGVVCPPNPSPAAATARSHTSRTAPPHQRFDQVARTGGASLGEGND